MSRFKRKEEHIRTALSLAERPVDSGFDDVAFVHNALPEISAQGVSLRTELFGKTLEAPLIINAITGGGGISAKINEALAVCARETGLGMAVGSQTIAIENPEYRESFEVVRRVNPNGLLMANIGAHVKADAACKCVEMISADVIQIHLNAPQEAAMGEGERDFRGWLQNIAEIVRTVEIPVVVKEVGFGLSHEVVNRLYEAGIRSFDIGGRGGTNFIAIEDLRGKGQRNCFESWGITTVCSLVETFTCGLACKIIATGGIRNGLDVAKAIALGANAAGVAGTCLKVLFENNLEGLIRSLQRIMKDLATVMQMLGVEAPDHLRQVPVVITGKTREWLNERGINTTDFARRSDSTTGQGPG